MKKQFKNSLIYLFSVLLITSNLTMGVFAYDEDNDSNEIISTEKGQIVINDIARDADIALYENGDVTFSTEFPLMIHIDGNEEVEDGIAPHDGSIAEYGICKLFGRILPDKEIIETGLTITTPVWMTSGTVSSWSISGDIRPPYSAKNVTAKNTIPDVVLTFQQNYYYVSIREKGTVTVSLGGGTFKGPLESGSFEPISGVINVADWF